MISSRNRTVTARHSCRAVLFASFLALFLTACAVHHNQADPDAPLARQLTAGAYCGLTTPGLVYLSSPDEVGDFIRQSGQNLTSGILKEHDFSREHLLVIAMGQKPTGGFSVVLDEARLDKDTLQIRARGRSPGPGDLVTQALTTPCAVVAVSAAGWQQAEVGGEGLPAMTLQR